jgi:hypothetical protein
LNSSSRTEAHKIFATLYRKQRSAEHQKLVDEAITKSNDVFIRIDLIKKIDEDFYKQERYKLDEEEKKEQKKSKPVANFKSGQTTASMPALEKSGFIDKIFGGGNSSSISKFAKESRALELGLFARRPTITKNVEKIFKSLKEDEIISTIQALKYSEQIGWKLWSPLVYNIIVNFNRFFNSFVSLDALFRDEISAEVFLGRSTKMQMYYARMLHRTDTKEVVLDKVPTLIKNEPKLYPKIESMLTGMNYALTLETRKPSLTDSIVAYHIVMSKKFVPWQEIERSLNVTPIDERKYSASPEVSKHIEIATVKIRNDIQARLNTKGEADFLKKNYFSLGEGGKISFDFVNLIIEDYVNAFYSDSNQTDIIKSNFKNMPHKLLQLVCKDLQSNFIPIVEGYIKIDNGQIKDVLIMQTSLFLPEIERINSVLRNLDSFNRKFPSFQYTFQNLSQQLATGGSQDMIETQLIKIINDASDFFHKFANKITVVVENHMLAKQHEENGTINEKVLNAKEKMIEEVKVMQRFIPFADARLITQNRLQGKTIFEALFDMTRLLYNYSVIFKDNAILTKLNQGTKIESDLQKLYVEYERLTSKPFQEIS